MTQSKIEYTVTVVEKHDTRIHNRELGYIVPWSGDTRSCDHCNKPHQIWYVLSDGQTVGAGCAKKLTGRNPDKQLEEAEDAKAAAKKEELRNDAALRIALNQHAMDAIQEAEDAAEEEFTPGTSPRTKELIRYRKVYELAREYVEDYRVAYTNLR